MNNKWILVLILLFAGAGFYFGHRSITNLKDDNQKKVDSLEVAIYSRNELIQSALDDRQTFLDSVAVLNSLNDDLADDYANLRGRLSVVVEEAIEIPPDTAYQALQTIYPDQSEKPYGFSVKQVKSIYIDVLSVPYINSMIVSLEERLSLREAEITLQRTVIREDSVIISGFVAQGANYREVISLKNQQIVFRDKKIRRSNGVKAAIGVGAFILGVLVAK